MIKPNEKEESFAKALHSNQMRLSERRVELRIKRLTLTVTKTVWISSSGTAAGY